MNPNDPKTPSSDGRNIASHLTEPVVQQVRAASLGMTGTADDPAPKIGYRSPPRAGRFKPGQSGNPKGCPRKAVAPSAPPLTPPLQQVQEHLTRPISIRDAEGSRQVPALLAAARMIEQGAAEGSVQLKKADNKLTLEAEQDRQKSIAHDHEFWRGYIKQHMEYVRVLTAKGDIVAEWLPYPEDIVMAPGQTVHYRGAITDAEAEGLNYLRRFRDAVIVKVIHDIYRTSYAAQRRGEFPDTDMGMVFIELTNRMFPKRIAEEGDYLFDEMQRLAQVSPRYIDREMTRAWAAFDIPAPRKPGFPPLAPLLKRLRKTHNLNLSN